MNDQLDRLTTALADRYSIERELGEGGMAVVYLAHDIKHNRKVAIKVLRRKLSAVLGAERFLKEIEVTASLQHPHILPLFDSGEADGVLYYVMPFIEGESLRQRLDRDQQLPVEEALRISAEVAGALDYAHRREVIHRDIKPANILLSEGHAIVADFGIARAIDRSGAAGMTQAGMAVGTPWYMSPEQATGDPNVDGRTDIYATGCMLFEMLSGKPPFDAPSAQAIIAKTISAPTPKLEEVAVSAPKPLQEYLEKALAKDPAERYQTAGDFAAVLRRGTGEVPVGEARRRWIVPALAAAVVLLAAALLFTRSGGPATSVVAGADVIAVLPFSAAGADVEYLAEGMVDLLSTNMNGVGGIRAVDSRRVISMWKKRGGETGLELDGALGVGRDVDAGSILLGSVVEAGSSVRFNAELYKVADGEEIARVQLDGSADSVLQLVDSLSIRLLRAAWRSREPLPSVSVSGITSGSMDAIRAYLKGAVFYREGQWDSAVTAFEQAVQHDSTFALANYHLASSQGWIRGLGSPEQRAAVEAAVRFADRLPERDRSVVMAYQHFQQNEMAAIDTLEAYVRQYPADAVGWHLLGDARFHARAILGLSAEQHLEPFDRAIELDSSFSPAVVHPTEMTLYMGDEARHRRYRELLSPNVQQAPQIRQLATVVFGDDDSRFAVLDTLTQSAQGLGAAWAAVVALEPATRRPALARFDSIVDGIPPEAGNRWFQAKIIRWMTALTLGRLSQANEIAHEIAGFPNQGAQQLGWVMINQMTAAGYTDPSEAEAGATRWLDGAAPQVRQFGTTLLAQLALSQGDAPRARELLASQTPTEVTNQGFTISIPALYRAMGGWASLVEGDTATGIAELRGGIEEFGLIFSGLQSGTGAMRFQLATAMARQPGTREEGINRLRYGFVADPEFVPIAYLTAAEILEEAGDREQAAALYSQFLDLWVDADPALQPRVEAARAALARVTSEPRNSN